MKNNIKIIKDTIENYFLNLDFNSKTYNSEIKELENMILNVFYKNKISFIKINEKLNNTDYQKNNYYMNIGIDLLGIYLKQPFINVERKSNLIYQTLKKFNEDFTKKDNNSDQRYFYKQTDLLYEYFYNVVCSSISFLKEDDYKTISESFKKFSELYVDNSNEFNNNNKIDNSSLFIFLKMLENRYKLYSIFLETNGLMNDPKVNRLYNNKDNKVIRTLYLNDVTNKFLLLGKRNGYELTETEKNIVNSQIEEIIISTLKKHIELLNNNNNNVLEACIDYKDLFFFKTKIDETPQIRFIKNEELLSLLNSCLEIEYAKSIEMGLKYMEINESIFIVNNLLFSQDNVSNNLIKEIDLHNNYSKLITFLSIEKNIDKNSHYITKIMNSLHISFKDTDINTFSLMKNIPVTISDYSSFVGKELKTYDYDNFIREMDILEVISNIYNKLDFNIIELLEQQGFINKNNDMRLLCKNHLFKEELNKMEQLFSNYMFEDKYTPKDKTYFCFSILINPFLFKHFALENEKFEFKKIFIEQMTLLSKNSMIFDLENILFLLQDKKLLNCNYNSFVSLNKKDILEHKKFINQILTLANILNVKYIHQTVKYSFEESLLNCNTSLLDYRDITNEKEIETDELFIETEFKRNNLNEFEIKEFYEKEKFKKSMIKSICVINTKFPEENIFKELLIKEIKKDNSFKLNF